MQNYFNETKISWGYLSITAEQIHHYPFHINKNLRLIYVFEGSIKIINVSGSSILNENDLEFINLNEPSEIIAITSDNTVLIMEIDHNYLFRINLNIDKIILNVASTQFFIASERHTTQENNRKKELLKSMFLDLLQDFTTSYNSKIIKHNLQFFCNFILEHFDDIKKHLSYLPQFNNSVLQRFQRIDYYIQDHLSEKIVLNNLVDLEFLSPQYISAEIKKRYKRTFTSIIEYYRITNAVRFIINDHSIKSYEIVQRSGFSNSKNFYRAFKRHMGCTPAVFKKKLASDGNFTTKFLNIQSHYVAKHLIEARRKPLKENNLSTSLSLLQERYNWSEVQPGYCVSSVELINFLNQYYSIFMTRFRSVVEITQDEIWFYHSGNSLEIYVKNPSNVVENKHIVLANENEGSKTHFISFSKGDVIYVTSEKEEGFTLISRLFLPKENNVN
ncbi:helix-turn-helix domain-containing protein [Virgibacillus oceani]